MRTTFTCRGRRTTAALAVAAVAGLAGTATASAKTRVSTAPVVAYQAAGSIGGVENVLEPGTFYPPTTHGFATLKRGGDWVQVNIQTSGLPTGAYTVWWVIFDTPAGCVAGCGVDDLFNQDANVSVFRATGKVVQQSGVGNFRARHQAGESLGEPGTQHLLGNGSLDPSRAEIHNVIKYHGPASDDRATLALQTQTVLGGCLKGANAVDLGAPFGIQCFDPQAVAHPLP